MSVDHDDVEVEAPEAPGNRPARWPFWLTFGGLLVLLTQVNQVFTSRAVEAGDSAANSILVDRAKNLDLLVGNYSRFRFNHPGPAFLYVQAAGESLFHDLLGVTRTPYAGQVLAVLVLNAFLVAHAASLVRRRANGPAAAAVIAGVLVVAVLEPGSLSSTGMPHLYIWPFLLFVVATASVCSGGWPDLWLLVLSGGLLVHGHVAFVLFVGLGAGAALLSAVLGRHGRPTLRQLAPAAALLSIFLLPMVLNLLSNWPGELERYWDFTRSGSAGGASLPAAIGYVAGLTRLDELGGVLALVVAAVAGSLRWAARRRPAPARTFTDRLFLVCLMMLAGGVFYAVRGVDDLRQRYLELFLVAVPVALFSAVVAQLDAVDKGPATLRRGSLVAAVVLVAGSALAQGPSPLRCDYTSNPLCPGDSTVPVLWDTVQREVPSGPLALLFDTTAWPPSVGVLEQARRAGRDVCVVDPVWSFLVTPEAVCTREQLARARTVQIQHVSGASVQRPHFRARLVPRG